MSNLYKELSKGNICLFETDTVVGLGCSLVTNGSYNTSALKKLYEIKGRNFSKPISWLVSGINQTKQYCDISKHNEIYVAEKWPGGYTFILKANQNVPENYGSITAGVKTLGVRQPNSKFLLSLLQKLDCPIVCTSANVSGKIAPTYISDVDDDVLRKVDYICEDPIFDDINLCNIKSNNKTNSVMKENSSTVIDLTGEVPVVLRG